MKKFLWLIVCLMTMVVSVNAQVSDKNYCPNIVTGENYNSVSEKLEKVYINHGYSGAIVVNITNEKFVGNTHIETYEFMGHGFFKYNGFLTKKGWLKLTFKNKKLSSLEIDIKKGKEEMGKVEKCLEYLGINITEN